MRIVTAFLLICCMVSPVAAMMSTTPDGSFQAIAQGPDTIALYWRHGGVTSQVFSDGKLLGTFQPDANSSFASLTVSSLSPNTAHTFTLGESGPQITESTWACLPSRANYDLLVIGGTASGVAAAIAGARMGLKVALVEPTNRLGGMSSNGLGSVDLRDMRHGNGLFQELLERVAAFYGTEIGRKFEPRVANAIIKSMVYEQPNITAFLKTTVTGAVVSGDRVLGAEVCDATGRHGRLLACVTVDATDTADFAASSGVQWRIGREAVSPREPHAGVIYFDDLHQKILPGSTGAADTKTQSYGYLMIWKDYGESGAPLIEKPRFYDPETYRPSPDWAKSWNVTSGKLPYDKYEINTHPFGGDWPGINYDYPTANAQRRGEIDQMYRDRALGYLYFMQNERGHKNLGLADDEFLDNGNFPVDLYIREARRVVGEHVLSEDEVTNARTFHRANAIAIGDYPMDSHAMEDLKDPTRLDKGEGEEYLVTFTPWHQVPYGVIVPCKTEGLLVTTAVSATHVAYGTLRLEPIRMSMGQAAAAAAYWSIAHNLSLRCVNPAWIQDKILSQHSYINWNSDVTAGTRHFKAINFMGARGLFPDEAFRPNDPLTVDEAVAALNKMLSLEGREGSWRCSESGGGPVTRGQFVLWLLEAKRQTDGSWACEPAGQTYTDVPPGSPYYAAVETARAHRITADLFENYRPGEFQPDAPITRADAAEAIYLAHREFAMNYWRP